MSSFLPLLLLLLTSLVVTVIPSASTPELTNKLPISPPPHTTIQSTNSMQMLPSEVETLFKIMENLSSDKTWRVSYPNPCNPGSSWLGIECKFGNDNHLHVTRLDFGTFPNPTCKPTAKFPSEIFTLPYLQSIFFYNCFTQTPTNITIPTTLSSSIYSPLQQLSLRSNPALTGQIPAQLPSLKSLQVLTMSQNRLAGQIPPGIFALSSLIHLDLSYNAFSGSIPVQVSNLRSLQGLDLSYNSLSGNIPNSIGNLGLLQKLDLSSNQLIGRIPNSIENLSSLAFLALSSNKLNGTFPTGMNKLLNLQNFIMDDNPMFVPLPTEFGMLVKLQELRLANCGYTGYIPTTFCQLINLTTLSLQNNRLTGEIPAGFSSLNHIYHLNLSRNFLQGAVPFNASFMKRLGKNLDLSENAELCLDAKEAYELKSKSDVLACGRHKSYSFTQPNKKSHSSFLFNPPMFNMLALVVMHLLVFMV